MMTTDLCYKKLEEYIGLVHLHGTFMLIFCILNLSFSLVATLGNLLVILALRKASSIPATLKKLLMSLAFSDLAVGLFAQAMSGVITALILNMAANGNNNYELLCPVVVTISQFSLYLLVAASCLSVAAIALDRLLAVIVHLRYQELVTPSRIFTVVWIIWVLSGIVAVVFVSLPAYNDIVGAIMEAIVLILTTVAYYRIYKIVRYHQKQIETQPRVENVHAMNDVARAKRSSFNTFCVYAVLLVCYLPDLCCGILLLFDKFRISFSVAFHVSGFLVFLNSSINPFVYCWRYRELREIMKKQLSQCSQSEMQHSTKRTKLYNSLSQYCTFQAKANIISR